MESESWNRRQTAKTTLKWVAAWHSMRVMIHDRAYMRETPYRTRWSITTSLIVINTAVYALGLIGALIWPRGFAEAMSCLALSPDGLARGWVWQVVTFQFLHAGLFHLVINCVMLHFFGRPLEETLGRPFFVRLYFGSGAMGGVLQVACAWAFPAHFGLGGVVGASAGIFGLIAAFALLNREMPITTLIAFVIPLTMRAKYLLVFQALIALLGLLSPASGVAHAAHLGGMVAAIGYLQLRQLAVRSRSKWLQVRPTVVRRELVGATSPRSKGHRQHLTTSTDQLSAADFMSREVDPILDKISAHGIQSLTEREKRILEAARAKMSRSPS